jgi:SAM-dependent methyltransferase
MNQFTVLAPHYDELMNVVPYDAWVDYVLLLFQIAEHDPKRLLDCACGTGNVSFELAKSNIEVVGVDIAPAMILEAQRKAQLSSTKGIRFLEADLGDFDLGEKFDSATCLYDSLNYILDPAHLERAFACVANHVESGGVWVFDMNSEYALTADLFTQSNRDPRRALHYDWRARYNSETKITSVEMEFTRVDESGTATKFHELHQERAYSRTEVEAMLGRTGWRVEKIYDAYTINPPHGQSERWFWVARRV